MSYKEDKHANSNSGRACQTWKFYDSMDTYCYHNEAILKHILASSSDNVNTKYNFPEVMTEESKQRSMFASSSKKVLGKIKFQKEALELIFQLVVNNNNNNMAKSMQVANGFINNLDKHIERLTNLLLVLHVQDLIG